MTTNFPFVSNGDTALPTFKILPVAGGGTGVTSLAADTLLQGGTTVTASNSLSANFTATTATASSTRSVNASNTDNTSGTSNASVTTTTGGSSSGDPYFSATITAIQGYSWGIDNSDSDSLKETNSNAGPSNGSVLRKMTSAGEQTLPLQPAFLAYQASTASNVTGDGTNYQLGSTVDLTEVFDQNSDFDPATGVFTAPVTGRYRLDAQAYVAAATALTQIDLYITCSNRNFRQRLGIAAAAVVTSWAPSRSVLADMDAADTAYVTLGTVDTGGKNSDVYGDADSWTTFSGNLEC